MISKELAKHIEHFDWKKISLRLEVYAALRLSSMGFPRAGAADVAHEAFRRLYEPEYAPWEPDCPTEEGLLEYLTDRIRDIVSQRYRERRREQTAEPELVRFSRADAEQHRCQQEKRPDLSAELQKLEKDWLAALEGDELGQMLVMCMIEGTHDTARQAAVLEVGPSEIERLTQKIRRALNRIRPEGRNT